MLTASCTLFALDGSPLALPDVLLQPFQNKAVSLKALTSQSSDPVRFQEGSVQVTFTGPSMGIGAQLTIADVVHGVSFDMEPPMGLASARLEGLWWSIDQNTSGEVMISNTSALNVNANLTLEWKGTAYPPRAIPLGGGCR